jgi:hypothetical protein
MPDEPPQLFLLHFWARDDALKLAWDWALPSEGCDQQELDLGAITSSRTNMSAA